MKRIELDEVRLLDFQKTGALRELVRLKTRRVAANEERDALRRLTEQLDERRAIMAHLRSKGAQASMSGEIASLTAKIEMLTDTLAARDKTVDEARAALEAVVGHNVEVEGDIIYVQLGDDPRVTEAEEK